MCIGWKSTYCETCSSVFRWAGDIYEQLFSRVGGYFIFWSYWVVLVHFVPAYSAISKKESKKELDGWNWPKILRMQHMQHTRGTFQYNKYQWRVYRGSQHCLDYVDAPQLQCAVRRSTQVLSSNMKTDSRHEKLIEVVSNTGDPRQVSVTRISLLPWLGPKCDKQMLCEWGGVVWLRTCQWVALCGRLSDGSDTTTPMISARSSIQTSTTSNLCVATWMALAMVYW